MRIALLAHCRHPIIEPYQGGLEMHTALLADEFVARGHDVTLVAKEGSRTRAELLPLVPATLHPGLIREHEVIADHTLAEVLPELDADVIVNNSLSAVPYLGLEHRPMLTVLHTPATLENVVEVVTRPGWRPSPLHRWAGVSWATARSWSTYLPAVHPVPNGIDLTHWAPTGVRPRPRHAVWTGRITPEKGLHLAIDAARSAGFSLSASGPVSDQGYFDAEIAPRLGPAVDYVGHLDHRSLPRFLQSGAVYVFSPLWPEPFGLALVEALAGGTPAAALAHGAVSEIVAPGAGVLATEPTVAALATAIGAAARLDRAAVAASVRSFDKLTMIDRYQELLDALVARTGSHGHPSGRLTRPDPTDELPVEQAG